MSSNVFYNIMPATGSLNYLTIPQDLLGCKLEIRINGKKKSILLTQQTIRIDEFYQGINFHIKEFSLKKKGANKMKFKIYLNANSYVETLDILKNEHEQAERDMLSEETHYKCKMYENYYKLLVEHFIYRAMGLSEFGENFINTRAKFADSELKMLCGRFPNKENFNWLSNLARGLNQIKCKDLFWTKKGTKSGNRLLHMIDSGTAKNLLSSVHDGIMLLRPSKDNPGILVLCYKYNGTFTEAKLNDLEDKIPIIKHRSMYVKFIAARSNNPKNLFIEKNDVL